MAWLPPSKLLPSRGLVVLGPYAEDILSGYETFDLTIDSPQRTARNGWSVVEQEVIAGDTATIVAPGSTEAGVYDIDWTHDGIPFAVQVVPLSPRFSRSSFVAALQAIQYAKP